MKVVMDQPARQLNVMVNPAIDHRINRPAHTDDTELGRHFSLVQYVMQKADYRISRNIHFLTPGCILQGNPDIVLDVSLLEEIHQVTHGFPVKQSVVKPLEIPCVLKLGQLRCLEDV